MNINLEVVRQTLKDAFGFNSFIAGFITDVGENDSIPTAGINANGEMLYNPGFVKKYVSCKEDLFSLIFHELLHRMFCHFIYKNGMIENISADAIINATISNIYCEESLNGNLFRKFYTNKGIQGLLRSESLMYRSKYHLVYEKLYSQRSNHDSLTTGELIQTLKILTQADKFSTIILIGNHQSNGQSESNDGFPKEVLAKIAEDIKQSLAGRGGRNAGFSLNLMELFMEALKTHLSIKKVLLQRFLTKRKLDKFRDYFTVRNVSVSPIPLYPTKRDLVLLAADFYPGYFHNKVLRQRTERKGLAIYLDVSGSVNDYLPKIIGILSKLRKDITSIFLFSNRVYEIRFEELLKGRIKTTSGTDFNCIAHSILERGFDKAVILTDGYASMNSGLAKQLEDQSLVTLVILFGEATDCEDLARFGDVVQLEDICE